MASPRQDTLMARAGTEGMELLGPLNLFLGPILWVAEQIADQAEETLLDEKPLIHKLTSLGADLDAGRITEDEFMDLEADLLEQIEVIEARKAEWAAARS
jgi:Gas vesicle protein G